MPPIRGESFFLIRNDKEGRREHENTKTAAAAAEKRVRVPFDFIEEPTRLLRTRSVCATGSRRVIRYISHGVGKKKCHIGQFHAILDVCRTGSHARTDPGKRS